MCAWSGGRYSSLLIPGAGDGHRAHEIPSIPIRYENGRRRQRQEYPEIAISTAERGGWRTCGENRKTATG
jgi:hypothetical protein